MLRQGKAHERRDAEAKHLREQRRPFYAIVKKSEAPKQRRFTLPRPVRNHGKTSFVHLGMADNSTLLKFNRYLVSLA